MSGAAPHWWIVTCRLAFDDEDNAYILAAPTAEEAMREAESRMRDDEDTDQAEGRAVEDDEPREFFVLWVFDCGEREPTVAAQP